ncbi:nucleotidyl transferase AbiEii/AbiGii toxin family protein [Sphingobacterium psychroaquaticum]|uniref:nucleotidyl transferase AbiEii/AbiGii toxin family protein n=1 Tax=Sphingobacterium psychroaquaticum TaxID=561061 RepID=UPI003742A0BE
MFSNKTCRDFLFFKGGTCLSKCYFPNYRFSENLDFTSINTEFKLMSVALSKRNSNSNFVLKFLKSFFINLNSLKNTFV